MKECGNITYFYYLCMKCFTLQYTSFSTHFGDHVMLCCLAELIVVCNVHVDVSLIIHGMNIYIYIYILNGVV